MITPGFFGLFNAQRGLIASQDAMNTVSNNISNANTPGYSRESVDLTEYTPYATPNMGQLSLGQQGQGPTVQQIVRNTDQFLTAQYRAANGLSGLDSTMQTQLQQVQGQLQQARQAQTQLQTQLQQAQQRQAALQQALAQVRGRLQQAR